MKHKLTEEQEQIINILGDSVRKYQYQRGAMREVFKKFKRDKNKVVGRMPG